MILFALISLSCISAADNNATAELAQDKVNTDEIVAQNDINTEKTLTNDENGVSDFSTLNTEIANTTKDTIQLTKNYTYNSEKDSNYTNGTVINRSDFTIDGQGHTIDGAGLARIFTITANNITLKNINFINGCSDLGGAINCEKYDLTIINCNFTNNKASEKGGALYVKESFANVVNSSFTKNNAPTGGSIYIESYILNIDHTTFAENKAFEGGAIYNEETVSITITNSQFANNTAKYGGAIRNEKGMLTLTNDEFTNNHADYNGGAIYDSGYADILNSTFANNYAEYGGAIIKHEHALILENTQFTNNNAAQYGGAIYSDSGNLKISEAQFANNTASQYGGAISNDGVTRLLHTQFTNNTATHGGAINNDNSLIISSSVLENNKATSSSGAIESDGMLIIESTQFTQNSAGYFGGAVGSWGKLYITDSNFTGNSARDTPGAVYSSEDESTIINTIFTNNTVGAIETTGDLTISNSKFIGNGENCINVESYAKITLNNVTSDVQMVNDTITMEILEAKDVVYGDDVNIKVQVNSSAIYPLNSGKVVIKVNNIEFNADVKDGIATLIIAKLNAGTYNTNVTYIDNNMSRAEIPVNFTVNKKDIEINAKNAAYLINYGGTYPVSFTNVADGTQVTFTLNGKIIGTSTIKNGTSSIKLTAKILKTAKAGENDMIIKIGNNNYSPISKTVKITINKEKTKITAKKKTFKKSKKAKKYTITLKNSKRKSS